MFTTMHHYAATHTGQTLGSFTGLCLAYLKASTTANYKQMAGYILAMKRLAFDYKLLLDYSQPTVDASESQVHQRTHINLNTFLAERAATVYHQLCRAMGQRFCLKLPQTTLVANEQMAELILLLDFLFSLANKHTPAGERITLRLTQQKQRCIIRVTCPKMAISTADLETIDCFITQHLATIKINESKTLTGINLLLRSIVAVQH